MMLLMTRVKLTSFIFPLLGATALVMMSFSSILVHQKMNEEQQRQNDDPRHRAAQNPVALSLGEFLSSEQQREEEQHGPAVFYPVEDPLPNPKAADGYNTFSACLLVMDDNHRLYEWMAYHYHVMPLRYLIVTMDPRSKTSPSSIFNRWRQQGVFIQEWGDRDFWRPDLKLVPIPDSAELQVKRDRHRGRQKYFYRKCLIQMKKANRTWVSLHDTDEYITYNHAGGDHFAEWEAKMQSRHPKQKRLKPSRTPPTTAEEGALIRYIRQEQAAGLKYYKSPCIGIPRLQFSAVDSEPSARDRVVPPGVDAEQLDTIRYRKHAERNDFVKNALGKVIVDVSRVDMEKTPNFMSLHRPIKSICSTPWHNDWESGLRINHYLGSWESYTFRDDARRGGERSREQYEYKNAMSNVGVDDNIRPWLGGFVQTHGLEKAQALLQGAGLPKGYKVKNSTAWTILQDRLEKILSTNETLANDNKLVKFDAWVREKYQGRNPLAESA